jgi:hypothetical protein
LYDIFFKPNSGNDVGTMCSNLNVINNSNARTTNAMDNFNHCKAYVNLETDAFITAAVMKHFGIESLETPAESFIPSNILSGTRQVKRFWFHQQIKEMLFRYL